MCDNKYWILSLGIILILLVFLFNSRIFLKEEENNNALIVNYAGFENTNNNISANVNEENNLNKSSVLKKDSIKEINYLTLHYDALLVDSHNDFIWKVFDKGAVFGQRNSFTQSDLPRFKAGGLDVQVFAVWIPMNKLSRSFSFVMSQIERLKNLENENSSDIEFAKNYDDIIRITDSKKICGLIGIEGGTAIEKNLDNINTFFENGVRYIGLTWNNSNGISTSARDETERGKKGGLTDFGIQVIKRMNEVGMLVDVSHLSEAGFWDVIENTSSPVIASHSNCYSLNPHFRNLTDEQIKAVAKNGGYIGVNFYDKFLDKDADLNRTLNAYEKYSVELNELNEKYGDDLLKYNEERDKLLSDKKISGGTSIEKVIEHIDYIKNLVGIDYVGIGSDFDGGITPPNELYDASTYPLITKMLVEKGYTSEEIKKVLGGNFLRVFRKVCG
ncbi:MAG TPA: dipeptidase [Ignavibacteria bacterium]|nr:dipeptidase [Ignavibacteria bacterium]